MIILKGMTWDHPRGLKPLVTASHEFSRLHPDIRIEWDARSLADFEAYPLELLAEKYDLLMIDHPHLGSAVKDGILLPLDDLLPADYMEDQRLNSVGQSFDSYRWEGRQWALAADAAAQVSAVREDLLAPLGVQAPTTWEEVRQLLRQLPPGIRAGLPFVPVHAFSCFVTLSAQLGGVTYWSDGSDLAPETGEAALALLQELMPEMHPSSRDSDPIAMSERMAYTNEIAYVPLMYGYVNYACEGFARQVIRFGDIPSDAGVPSGSMIGGVGIAVSARCKHKQIAAEFARFTADGEFQRTLYFKSGGQPGHRGAWTDKEVNRLSGGFFERTLRTLDHGFMRPRFSGFISFQEQAGSLIRDFVLNGDKGRKDLVRKLNGLRSQLEQVGLQQ